LLILTDKTRSDGNECEAFMAAQNLGGITVGFIKLISNND